MTWDRFEQIGADLHAKHPDCYMTVAVTDGYVRYILKPMIEQITDKISVQDDKTVGFTVDEMAKAFDEFMKVFTSLSAQPYSESVIYDSLQNNPLWLNGKIGAYSCSSQMSTAKLRTFPTIGTLRHYPNSKVRRRPVRKYVRL